MWPAEMIPWQWVYVMAAVVMAVYALAAALRGWFYDRAKGRPRCRRCGYPAPRETLEQACWTGCLSNQSGRVEPQLKQTPPWSCPECGWSPKRVKDLLRPRRSRKWFAVSALLLAGAWSSWYAIHVQFRRLKLHEPTATALTPTTWWIALLPNRTGDEDLIVYHRAYPWAKLMNPPAHGAMLPGSGRTVPLTNYAHRGIEGGYSRLWGWQTDWSIQQSHVVMQDATRPIDERCDAVWLYARLTHVDERDDAQQLVALLDYTEPRLTEAVLRELENVEVAIDLAIPVAAHVMQDARHHDAVRFFAARVLGRCGVSSASYLLPAIGSDDAVLRRCVFSAMEELHWAVYLNDEPIEQFMLMAWDAYRRGKHTNDLFVGLFWIDVGFSILTDDDVRDRVYLALAPQLDDLRDHPDPNIRNQVSNLDRHRRNRRSESEALGTAVTE